MLSRIRGRHHIVVAYLALFLALGGSAMAAKPLIDGSDVRDESLTSADIENSSLTGDDILETSLGKVAAADTLDGKSSTDFAESGQACDAGYVVTGIGATGKIVCGEAGEGGGETPILDYCDGVDDDSDGTDGEDHPLIGTPTQYGGSLQCIDGEVIDPAGEMDSDGDGFTPMEGDCDDSNANLHPGAPEIDDDIDNDCDGLRDESD